MGPQGDRARFRNPKSRKKQNIGKRNVLASEIPNLEIGKRKTKKDRGFVLASEIPNFEIGKTQEKGTQEGGLRGEKRKGKKFELINKSNH